MSKIQRSLHVGIAVSARKKGSLKTGRSRNLSKGKFGLLHSPCCCHWHCYFFRFHEDFEPKGARNLNQRNMLSGCMTALSHGGNPEVEHY